MGDKSKNESEYSSHQERPVYPMGIVAELLEVHPETIRVWERAGLMRAARRSGKRYYTENDLKRLRFVQRLVSEGLNIPAIRHYLRLYACWNSDGCPSCVHRVNYTTCAKPCWKDEGTYCQAAADEDTCASCRFRECPGQV